MPRRTFRLIGARRVIVIDAETRTIAIYEGYTERAVTVPAPEPRWNVKTADQKPEDMVRRYELGFAPVEELEDGRGNR